MFMIQGKYIFINILRYPVVKFVGKKIFKWHLSYA